MRKTGPHELRIHNGILNMTLIEVKYKSSLAGIWYLLGLPRFIPMFL